MICEKCGKRPAVVHFTKIINGVKQEFNLCEECARDIGAIDFENNMNFISTLSFKNILGGIMDYINQSTQNSIQKEEVCSNCGMSYNEFKKNGLMGCSECYKSFEPIIMPVIKRIQGNVEHVGKVPKRSGRDILEKKEITKLKKELQEAVAKEEYEKAAEIRDKIKEIKKEK